MLQLKTIKYMYKINDSELLNKVVLNLREFCNEYYSAVCYTPTKIRQNDKSFVSCYQPHGKSMNNNTSNSKNSEDFFLLTESFFNVFNSSSRATLSFISSSIPKYVQYFFEICYDLS